MSDIVHGPGYAAWRSLAEADLKGPSFEKRLVSQTLEGLRIEPLYDTAPQTSPLPLAATPGYLPGTMVLATNDALQHVQDDVQGGSLALLLCEPGVRSGAASDSNAAETLDELASLALESGLVVSFELRAPLGIDLARAFLLVHGADGLDGNFKGSFSVDPLADALDLGTTFDPAPWLGTAIDLARAVTDAAPDARVLLASTHRLHDAGADPVLELTTALASGLAWLRAGERSSLEPARVHASLTFRMAAGRDFVLEVCKFRALRAAWARLLELAGADASVPAVVEAVTSRRTLTRLDVYNGMVRGTIEAAAAALGTADRVFVTPYDDGLGAPSAVARRLARNTALVAAYESHLGHVADPAAGAWTFETLTDQMAELAWQWLCEIEAAGGLDSAAGQDWVRTRLAEQVTARNSAIRKRTYPIIGAGDFALGTDDVQAIRDEHTQGALPVRYDDEVWLHLRKRAAALPEASTVQMLVLGNLDDVRARLSWTRTALGAGGLRLAEHALPDAETPFPSLPDGGVVLLCGADATWLDLALSAAAQVAPSARRVVLAGRPKDDAALRQAGVADFLYVGADLVTVLSSVIDSLEAV
jgi:methylmalonyl-CoA mutase